jgi:DNA-binding NtrC family response regulator
VIFQMAEARLGAEIARFFFETSLAGTKVPVVIINDTADIELNLSFMRMGAVECLNRPLSISRLALLADMTTARASVAASSRLAPSETGEIHELCPTASMQAILREIQLVAGLDTTVLLTGETGTGKTRVSRLIHNLSPRRDKPFLTVNCGALSETLISSELFGHVRGAFTGADQDKPGKFAQAADGTLLLDDVECLSPESQAKFLRAIDERRYEQVGSQVPQKVRARFVVATNKSLEQESQARRFRLDLFYRLSVITFYLPPLRERRDEIQPLAEQFAEEFGTRHKRPVGRLTREALSALESHSWPGNVRELRNVMERAVILSNGAPILATVLPESVRMSPTPRPQINSADELDEARRGAERDYVAAMLRRHANNRTKVAQDLGISRTALYKKLHKLKLA